VGANAFTIFTHKHTQNMQFVENFNDYQLVPIETRQNLGLYMPILNEFEIQDFFIGLDSKCIKIARAKYESVKEDDSKEPISPEIQNELKYMRLNAWGVRALPKNVYEYKVMKMAEEFYNVFFATLFLCDNLGNSTIQFETGATISKDRIKLVKSITSDAIAAAQIRNNRNTRVYELRNITRHCNSSRLNLPISIDNRR